MKTKHKVYYDLMSQLETSEYALDLLLKMLICNHDRYEDEQTTILLAVSELHSQINYVKKLLKEKDFKKEFKKML